MPSLSDKLKSLGVKIGAQELPPPQRSPTKALEEVLLGAPYPTPQGETFLVDGRYPAGYLHGRAGLQITAPLNNLARWAGDTRIAELSTQSLAFLDTETTGLSGGSGTYAFLIGVGRFEGEEFHLAQFFMRDPIEEPAQLAALEEFLAPCQAMVTFNGKAFDVPLIHTRFLTYGLQPPFGEMAHIDLLHLARRLWRERLPDRSLANLEVKILEAARTAEDVPGWMIPSLYFQFLRDGDPGPLKNVFYHNAMDVVSLAALLNHTAGVLANPLETSSAHAVDLVALAKLFEDMGDREAAVRLYVHGLEHPDVHDQNLPESVLLEALERLAFIHKRQGDYLSAITIWEEAARHNDLEAHIELAKYYEHHLRDFDSAIHWTGAAIALVEAMAGMQERTPAPAIYERNQWLAELHHRLERLLKKSGSNAGDAPTEISPLKNDEP